MKPCRQCLFKQTIDGAGDGAGRQPRGGLRRPRLAIPPAVGAIMASAATSDEDALAGMYLGGGGDTVGLFKKTVNDQDWLLIALPLYESARPIMTAFSDAFVGGHREELNGVVGKVLEELPTLVDQLGRLPNPRSREARVAGKTLKRSLRACVRGARELDSLFEFSARGLRQMVASHGDSGEMLLTVHLNAIQLMAGKAASLMSDAGGFFAGASAPVPAAPPQ